MSSHVSSCVLTANEFPAILGDVARPCARPLVSNQIRDALVHSLHIKLEVPIPSQGNNPREACVQIPELSFEVPGMPRYEAEPVVIWV